jgi:hypothetical protein
MFPCLKKKQGGKEMAFDYDKDFYVKQDLQTLLTVLMHLIKNHDSEKTLPIRQAIEEKLKQGLTEKESKQVANTLYNFCRKYVLLAKKVKEEVV